MRKLLFQLKKSMKIQKKISLLLIFLISSCDFSPNLQKNILKAQESIYAGKYELAISLYKSLLKQPLTLPVRLKAYYQLGQIYELYLQKHEEALNYYRKIEEEAEDLPWALKAKEKQAQINFHFLRNFSQAASHYQNLVEISSSVEERSFYEYRLAQSLLKAHHLEKLLRLLKKMELNPQHAYYKEIFFMRGQTFFYQGKWQEAIKQWREYLLLKPSKESEVQTQFLIANALETAEELKEAFDLYSSILKSYPHPEIIKEKLESLYARKVARRR